MGMFRLEKRRIMRHLTVIFNYLMGRYCQHGASFFYKVNSKRMRGNGHKLKHAKFRFSVRKSKFSMIEVRHWNRAPETVSRDIISIFEDMESRHGHKEITVVDLAVDRRPPETPSNLYDITNL